LSLEAPIKDRADSEGQSPEALLAGRHHPAEKVFSILMLALSIWLLLNIEEQANFSKGKGFINQPGFWPAISLSGMALFSAIYTFECWGRTFRDSQESISGELSVWLRVLEFPVWFLGYVWLVPVLGYLPSTIALCFLLALRLGYRSAKMLLLSVGGGMGVVVIFKTFLSVKIPGGEVYDHLPEVMRNFMILNF